MYIFFIVVWIVAIYCIFRNPEVGDVKGIENNDDPVDDPEYMKKNPELNLRYIINNQVLDDADNLENKKDN